MDEIQCAIDRIDNPHAIGDRTSGFLAKDRVVRKSRGQLVADVAFDGVIGGAHPILAFAL